MKRKADNDLGPNHQNIQADVLTNSTEPVTGDSDSAMSVGAPEVDDSPSLVQTQADGTSLSPQLNPNVQTFVSPSTPGKRNEKPILEVTFTAFPDQGNLDGIELLGKLTKLLGMLGVKSSNISIRKINKKF